MKEFRHIWESYMDGEPKSKVIKESHHIEDEDNEVTGEKTVLEHLQLAMDAQIKISGGFGRAAKELIELLQENLEEEDSEEDEEDEEDEEEEELEETSVEEFQKKETEPIGAEETKEFKNEYKFEEESADPDEDENEREEAKDKAKALKVNESMHLIKEENIRLKEDLSLLVHRLKRHGLIED